MARRSAHAVLSIKRNNSVLKLSAFAVATAMASHQVRNLECGEGFEYREDCTPSPQRVTPLSDIRHPLVEAALVAHRLNFVCAQKLLSDSSGLYWALKARGGHF